MRKTTTTLLSTLALATLGLFGGSAAQAQESPWLLRLRAVHLDSVNHDTTPLNLSINNRFIPEADVSYFFTPNIAAELVLTYPQRQTLSSNGARIGTLEHLPPTLTVQYHFSPEAKFRPYVGAGLNYTRFSNVKFDPVVAALSPSIKKDSTGFALQAGFDVALDKNWSLNFDVKKVQIKTTVYAAGTPVGKLKLDPVLFGVGIGYRF